MRERDRRRRTKAVKPVSELVERVLSGYNVADDVRKRRILTDWQRIVGARIAKNTEPGRVHDGVLDVRVRTSSWMHELSFMTEDIRARINQALGEPVLVAEIRWILSRPRQVDDRPLPARKPPPGERYVVKQSASAERMATIRAESASVEDDELRALIADVRARYDL